MNATLFQWSQIGGAFGVGAGFAAMLGSLFASLAPTQKLEQISIDRYMQQQELWVSILDAHLASDKKQDAFEAVSATEDARMQEYLIQHLTPELETQQDLRTLHQLAAAVPEPNERAKALMHVAKRQCELSFDASDSIHEAQVAAVQLTKRYGANSWRYRTFGDRALWPIFAGLAGATLALAFGYLHLHRPSLNRWLGLSRFTRKRRIGF